MDSSNTSNPRVGRILTDDEKAARVNLETASAIEGEQLRSAFAINERFVLTAWHCVRDAVAESEHLWMRLRRTGARRSYSYIPIRVTNYDVLYDIAVLTIDLHRLADVGMAESTARDLLAEAAFPLVADVAVSDQVQVIGFPLSAPSADSDTNAAEVIDVALDVGDARGIKLFGPAFAAVSPVNPHGISGGPVLTLRKDSPNLPYAAVGVVRAVPMSALPGVAGGGGIIATRIADMADRLPEIGIAMLAIPQTKAAPHLLSLTKGASVATALSKCGQELRRTLVRGDEAGEDRLIGWPHFFDEPSDHRRPTAIGTAYGLKLSLLLGTRSHGIDRSALSATLWRLRRPDGGWSARTGVGISRPEVTALILGALTDVGDGATELPAAIDRLESNLAENPDPVGLDRTYIVSAVVRGLVRARPDSRRLTALRQVLLAGAIRDGSSGLVYWSTRLRDTGGPRPASVAHTAQAIVALARVGEVTGYDNQSRDFIAPAIRWLSSNQQLYNQTEQIRRFVADNSQWDTLTVRHFSAAWVARALLLAAPGEEPPANLALADAIRQVWSSHHDGIWVWDDGDRPIWMTYQGASVLHDYALRTAVPA